MPIRLRDVTEKDITSIFKWRNDPWIVSLSTSRKTVTWDEHVKWFAGILDSGRHLLFIIESDDGTDMGLVRFDRRDDLNAAVTIYLLRPFVGQGHGVTALKEACRLAFDMWSLLQSLHACIRGDNSRSTQAFSKAGFRNVKPSSVKSSDMVEMVRNRGDI